MWRCGEGVSRTGSAHCLSLRARPVRAAGLSSRVGKTVWLWIPVVLGQCLETRAGAGAGGTGPVPAEDCSWTPRLKADSAVPGRGAAAASGREGESQQPALTGPGDSTTGTAGPAPAVGLAQPRSAPMAACPWVARAGQGAAEWERGTGPEAGCSLGAQGSSPGLRNQPSL